MNPKIPLKKWLLGFLVCMILGIFLFFASIAYIFKPNFSDLFHTGFLLLSNLGNKSLKMKAYFPILFALMPLIVLVAYFFIRNNKSLEDYGSASFATEQDFEKMGVSKETGLMLGVLHDKKGNIKEFIRCKAPLACLIVAPPGTGKTAAVALPNLFSIPNSMVILDIKGELYQKSAGYRQQNFHHKILRFSPLNEAENTMFFNPFDKKVIDKLDYVELKQLADQIAGTIFVGEKGKENDHWIVSAKTLFSFWATYFMQKNKHTTLGEIAQAPKKDFYDLIDDEIKVQFGLAKENEHTKTLERDLTKDTSKAFFKSISQDESLNQITRNQANFYINANDQEFGSIKSTFDTFMAVFQNPRVINATSTMSFDYYDLREEKISCYIVVQSEDIDILAPLIRIFVETMCKKLMSGKECSDPNKFVYFLGDEFVRFKQMPYLLESPALCRSYGFIPIYITQSYEQIKKYYGEDDLNILRSNVGYQVVFTMNSAKDAEELSKMIGKFTRKKISRSQGNLDLIKSSDSLSSEGYELVPAQDILNMPNTDILILIRGFTKHPIQAKVNFWFKNKEWQGADKIAVLSEQELKDLQKTKKAEAESQNAEAKEQNKESQNTENTEQQTPRAKVQVVMDSSIQTQPTSPQTTRNNYIQVVKQQKLIQKIQEQKQEQEQLKERIQELEAKEEKQGIKQESEQKQEQTQNQYQEKLDYIKKELGLKGEETFFKYQIRMLNEMEISKEAREQRILAIRESLNGDKISLETIKEMVAEIKGYYEESS